jgi:outer membrane protein assembly factor BamB
LTAGTIGAQTPRAADGSPLSLFPARPAWTLALNNPLAVPPVYSGSHAYFALDGDRLAAYELERGRQEWIVAARPIMDIATGDGLLFLVERAGVTALRARDGSTAWQLPALGELAAPPVWDNGWLILVTGASEVLAFRASDGHLVWRRGLGSRASARPSLAADRVDVPLEDGRIVALRVATGDPMWERRLGGRATGLLAVDDRLYAGSTDNFLYALDAKDGRVAWRWRTGADVIGVPVVDERHVYFVSLDNALRALSRKSGVQRWVRLLPLRPTRGPLEFGGALLISGIAPMLHAYNTKDGTPAGELAAAGELAGAPHAVLNAPGGLPQVLVVTRDIAKGASATLFVRQLEPPLTRAAEPAHIFKPVVPEP